MANSPHYNVELREETHHPKRVIKRAKHFVLYAEAPFSLKLRLAYLFQGVCGMGTPVLAAIQGVCGIGTPVLATVCE
ncbi:MAG: hypothetical protein ACREBQ_13015 [Nitrososphaerales archaeon]